MMLYTSDIDLAPNKPPMPKLSMTYNIFRRIEKEAPRV